MSLLDTTWFMFGESRIRPSTRRFDLAGLHSTLGINPVAPNSSSRRVFKTPPPQMYRLFGVAALALG